ncbi:MAG: TM0106 family RecB-like putative nuclease [Burkholderiales bacterium]|nr:TM0106 family RecB-like putative nuclease [Burkholderiales bacterium]
MSSRLISGSMLYDVVKCPHRVYLDKHGEQALRDEPSAFIEMLWEKGCIHEGQIVEGMVGPLVNVADCDPEEKEAKTREAIEAGAEVIYSGRIVFDDLVGEPDLLKRSGDGYRAGDIKSGAGLEGEVGDGKLKKHYALQVAHYTNILNQIGKGDGTRNAFIIDRDGNEVLYPLDDPQGPRTPTSYWTLYLEKLEFVRGLVNQRISSRSGLCSHCKECHWQTACKRELINADDLTLICELGPPKRDVLYPVIPTVKALSEIDPSIYFKDNKKTIFDGIGPDSLIKFRDRANLLAIPGSKPFARQPLAFPNVEIEVFFDLEDDPFRDFCYLHGFLTRTNSAETFAYFYADEPDPAAEEQAFAQAWNLISNLPESHAIYYYSTHERTYYKKLATRYPRVCSVEAVEALFEGPKTIDLLFEVVRPFTEWPTYDRSVKTLAKYLGFEWRDQNPSGAASIEWFQQWLDTNDPAVKQRILDYNEDDCRAMRVLLDGLRAI